MRADALKDRPATDLRATTIGTSHRDADCRNADRTCRGNVMRRATFLLLSFVVVSCGDDDMPTAPTNSGLSFFVTSVTSTTGNLGGLSGADATCQRLAQAVGSGRTWRAYLSV